MSCSMKKVKDDILIEKETIIKEVRGEMIKKVTIRILISSEGKVRSIVFTPIQFNKFKKEVNKLELK